MVRVDAPKLLLSECRSEEERRFFERLNHWAVRGGWDADSWPHHDGHTIISVCPGDAERRCILRTLRVDYVVPHLLMGKDETHQFATDLDPGRAGVVFLPNGEPEDLADVAGRWFEHELSRQIVREEWVVPGKVRERWVMGDTGQVIVHRGDWSKAVRDSLGPPDKSTIVWPRRNSA